MNADQWWDSLLRYIDDGKVVPIVGRDLLWLDAGDKRLHLPRLLAEQLAERLGVPHAEDAEGDPVDAVVRAYYLRPDHDHERPYAELSALVKTHNSNPPPPAFTKLAELPFQRFISTTYDDLLPRAVGDAAKADGGSLKVVVNSLGSVEDIPKVETPGERVVVQMLGRANPTTDYAITDADVLEFVHQFQRNNQPEHLLNTIRKQHVLLLGSGFSDWLTRFLLRVVRADRLWMNKGLRHFFADREASHDPRLRSFLEHPLTTAAVFQTDDATAFVDELHRRWTARGGRSKPSPAVHQVMTDAQANGNGRVFLSYASEDQAVAQRVNDILTAAGIDVWFDRTGFTAGDDWNRIIQAQIERCFLFLPLLSRHTQASEGFFYQEWRCAEERARRIAFGVKFAFPVVIDDSTIDADKLPDLFKRSQRTTARGGELTQDFVRTLREAYRVFQTAGV